jgi:hypothetical protein
MNAFHVLVYAIIQDFNNRCKIYKLTKPEIDEYWVDWATHAYFAVNSNSCRFKKFMFAVAPEKIVGFYGGKGFVINQHDFEVHAVGHDGTQLGLTKCFDMNNPKFDERKVVNCLFRKLNYKTNGKYDERTWFSDAYGVNCPNDFH